MSKDTVGRTVGIILLVGISFLVIFGLALSLMQYVVIAVVILALTGLVLLLAVLVLRALVRAARVGVTTLLAAGNLGRQQERRVRSAIALCAGVVTLGLLLVLGQSARATIDLLVAQAPPTAAVVANSAEHAAVEAVLDRTAGIPVPTPTSRRR